MSILIRGMEMPTSCAECLLADCSKSPCYKVGGVVDWERRPDWCPLIEIPPHGRLIDADALVADLKGQVERLFNLDAVSESDFFIERNEKFRQAMWKNWCESFYEYLSTRPTIIPAEEGNTWI